MSLRQIISTLSFIGVIFHEFGHQVFCNLTGVKVHKVCYFRNGNPAGYVIHGKPKNFTQSFLITVGPFITGTLFAILFYRISIMEIMVTWQKLIFIWLGGSVAIHSFPSDTDGKSLLRNTNQHIRKNLLALLGYPAVFVIWLVNWLHLVWFDLIYTILLYAWVIRLSQ